MGSNLIHHLAKLLVFAPLAFAQSLNLLLLSASIRGSTKGLAEYAYQIQNSFQCNDHLEFGPNTSPLAGRQRTISYRG